MSSVTIEELLHQANSSTDGDTSVASARRRFLDEDAAKAFFEETCSRLFRIDEWNANSSVTEYELFGAEDGHRITTGCFIRIKLYGSGKSDWVRVMSVNSQPGELILTVKPTYDPTERPVDESVISHFFGAEATNNFCLQRTGNVVTMYVIGLNEKQNSRFTDGLIESARNVTVANVGYYTGLQKSVWISFCKNFLKADEEDGS